MQFLFDDFDFEPKLDAETKRRVDAWLTLHKARCEAKIAPNESDRQWLEKHRGSSRAWARNFHVRDAVPTDYWRFDVLGERTEGRITIVRNFEFWRAVMAADVERFGPVVNSDSYATMRLQALHDDRRRARRAS